MNQPLRWGALGLCLAAASCNDEIGPGPGAPVSMRVSVSITGGDHDLDGVVVHVDGEAKGTTNTSLEITGLRRGTHEVTLSGIAPNCDLQGAPVRSVALPSTSYFAASFQVRCFATGIDIGNVTTGIDYGTAYAVQVGSMPDVALTVNSRTTLGRMTPGRHTVMLKLDPALTNCQVDGAGVAREVDVVLRAVAPVTFGVTCLARFGAIQVMMELTGVDGDATSYLASVDDGTPRALSAIGRVIFDTLTPGEHTIRVSGGRENCLLTGPTSSTASVQAGGLARHVATVNFQASCVELERKVGFTRYPFEAPHWGYDPFVALVTELGGNLILLAGGAAPSWSPDGLRVAFVRIPTGCYYGCFSQGISVIRRNGTELVHLTNTAEDWGPTWSPDGAKIAFGRGSRLWVMNANGSSQAEIPSVPTLTGFDPAWSPDGSRLAYVCPTNTTDTDICLINLDGTGFVRFAAPTAAYSPAWHPDGTRLVFSANTILPSSESDIVVMKTDGTGVTKITTGDSPVWSPDGSRIFFARLGALFSIAANGSEFRPIVGTTSGWNTAPSVR